MGLLSWLIYRSRLPGAGLIEYIVMFPQAVPRLVFAFGMMWAWLVFPIPIYGTMWLLLIAYLTVFLPLGVRTISGVMLQIDKSLEECAQMCGASWTYRMRTVTVPLLVPGLIAAWLLLFIASVRELGASILLMGPHSKVITPAIVESWFGTRSELTATMALIQTLVVAAAMVVLVLVTRRLGRRTGGLAMPAQPHIEVEDLADFLRHGAGRARRQLHRAAGRAADAARPVRLRQDHDAARDRRAGAAEPRAKSASAARRSIPRRRNVNIPAEKRGLSMVFQSYAIWPHMTVFDNVAYGLRVRRAGAAEITEKVHRALDMVQMRDFADRRASQLSGGQQQRVALARAFVFSAVGAAVRRAAVQSRRQAARRHAHRVARAAAPARRHLGLCDARPRGGAGDVRPHRGDARRTDRADRHAGRHLQPAAQRLRRRLRRLGQSHSWAQPADLAATG